MIEKAEHGEISFSPTNTVQEFHAGGATPRHC